MRLTITDRISYNIGTSRVMTDEGFLRVPGHVSRTGILTYLARELNLDGDPNRLVNVYRPSDEVFSPDSLASFAGADITIEHPGQPVNADNYNQTSAGVVVGQGMQDGECVRCDLLIKSADAVKAVQSGKCELSCGYTALYDSTSGMTEDGTQYEFIQRDIKINHVAIVSRGRSGSNVRIFDNKPEKPAMKIVALTNDRSIEVEDAAALLISDTIAVLTKRAEDAEAKADMAEAEKEDMKEKMVEMDKKSCDAAISERVQLLMSTTADARKVAGDAFTTDADDIVQIMRDALTVKRPTIQWSDKSPAYVQAAWDLALTDDAQPEQQDQYKQLAKDAAIVTPDAQPSAYDKRKAELSTAWKVK